jgi:hypothetical protein
MGQRRSPTTILAAWVVTGPLGHLCSGLADVGGLVRAWARARIRARPRPSVDRERGGRDAPRCRGA